MDWRNLNKNNDKYSQKNEVKDDFLLSNPYADLDNLENVDQDAKKGGRSKLNASDLTIYQLPQHKFQIEYFKLLHHDVYESEKRHLPNALATVTQKNEIFLWQENILNVRCLRL